jgi:hypothetical protein
VVLIVRVLMGVIKDRHGTYCARKTVPEKPKGLQTAVARVLDNGKAVQKHLKRSLGTKDLREANIRAKPVLAEFDRIIALAKAGLATTDTPTVKRTSLNDTEIKRLAEWVYANALEEDEALRFSGRLELIGPHGENVNADAHGDIVQDFRQQFAAGDVSFGEQRAQKALACFGITLNQSGTAYHNLCIESAKAFLKALDDIGLRYVGAVIETPRLPDSKALGGHGEGETLKDALEGWKNHRARPKGTVNETGRSVDMFTQLHGNMAVAAIRKKHALEYRKALQDVPRRRTGSLLGATLPEQAAWGREHPEALRITAATINKQLGGVQAICVWASDNGLIPDDVQWSDPFSRLRLPTERSERTSFDRSEGWLRCSLNKGDYTGQYVKWRMFDAVRQAFTEAGLVEHKPGYPGSYQFDNPAPMVGKLTRYRATPSLLASCEAHGVTPANVRQCFQFEEVMPSELVQLTSPSHKTPNTEKVQQLRAQVAELNAFFAGHPPAHVPTISWNECWCFAVTAPIVPPLGWAGLRRNRPAERTLTREYNMLAGNRGVSAIYLHTAYGLALGRA